MTAPGIDLPPSEAPAAADDRWPLGWVVSASVALLSLAAWQRSPAWVPLASAGLATATAAWQGRQVRRPRSWVFAATMLLALALVVAVVSTLGLDRVARDWSRWSSIEREDRATRVATRITTTAEQLVQAASEVANDPARLSELAAGVSTTTRPLAPPLDASIESAVLVFRGDRLVARAGQVRTRIPAHGERGVKLVDEPFYGSLVARAIAPDGSVEVVAVALVSAIPPADRFARALTQTLGDPMDVRRTLIESPDSARVGDGETVIVVTQGNARLARVRALARTEGETQLALLQRARARTVIPLALAALVLLVAAWRRPARTVHRLGVSMTLWITLAVAPLSALSNVSPLFDASSYFAAMGGPWTANVAALLLSTALGLAMLFLSLRSGRVTRVTSARWLAAAVVLVSATLGPFVLRDLARGIKLPADGGSLSLWIAWQLAIALAGVCVLHAGAAAGRAVLGTRRGLPSMMAPLLAIGAAVLAPVLWRAPGGWPAWYPVCWALAIGALALTRRGVALVTGAAVIAGAGATTLTWGATVRARMNLAQFDLARLSSVDRDASQLLARFAGELAAEASVGDTARNAASPDRLTADALLRRYAASELAQAGYPARIARWDVSSTNAPATVVALVPVEDTIGAQSIIATLARESRSVEIRAVEDGPTTILVAAVPSTDGRVTTIAVPPRTRLLPTDPFASLTGVAGARTPEAPYRLTLAPVGSADTTERALQWRRRGNIMHGDGVATGRGDARQVHVEVELRGLDQLLARGALLVLLDVAVVLLLWGASAMADGAFGRWFRVRRARLWRSYRARLSAALLAAFIAPAALFGGWSWYRLQDDDRAARALLLREALRTAAGDAATRDLAATSASVGAPFFLYRAAQLDATSDSLLQSLAPLGRLLPVSLDDSDFGADDVFATRRVPVGRVQSLIGYRRVAGGQDLVVVTPARGDEFALDARREDLGVLLLFTVALGALVAMWSSGVAARSLARPVGALSDAALAIAAGRDARALGQAPASEFAPVYRAFSDMADDLSTSRAALEAAQRRTAAVLQHVASGVLAMRRDGEILIANPRAEQLLGASLRHDGASLAALPSVLSVVVERCQRFLENDAEDDAFEQRFEQRQLRGRLTRLPGGAVLTVDDITELASAQRVLAWGEMARQVAHEIKNPLTPIRLGVQHLRRAYRDGRGDFASILDTNVTRVLAEIDHLDEIARAFSRYGMAPDQRPPAMAVNVVSIVRDVLALEQLGESGVQWTLTIGREPVVALGQRAELKEVLLNLLENARLAQARHVGVHVDIEDDAATIDVRDDGLGIAADVLPQVFEPHFSTRTSGSGLGLAISRRLIEGWGGRITLESAPGSGTVAHVRLRLA